EYDYIVVGSGPGGGTVACQLARANLSVLLIEAGDDLLPGGLGDYTPGVTWDFFVKHYSDDTKTMKNNYLTWKKADGRYWVGKGSDTPPAGSTFLGVYYPRGASVGGSSMINAMATLLPPDSDWDIIAQETGDSSWSGANMRDLFVRIEHNNWLPRGTPGHGFDGFFQNHQPPVTSLDDRIMAVSQAIAPTLNLDPSESKILEYINLDVNSLDPNRDTTTGIFGIPFHTYENGTRFSSRAWIQETIKAGFPLTLQTNSLATSVLWEEESSPLRIKRRAGKGKSSKPKAVGINYLSGTALYKADRRSSPSNTGIPGSVRAKHEVIISGGAFNTPQLLKLSGIGPAAELAQHNIPLVVDSPGVGTNLMDNEELPIVGHFAPGAPPGPFAGMAPGTVMLHTPHARTAERDVYIMHGPLALRGFYPTDQDNTLPVDPQGTYGISIVKQFPENRAGSVLLRSSDPRDTPLINLELYGDAGGLNDLEVMKDVVKWARGVYQNVSAPYGPATTVEPPCDGDESECEAVDEDWIVGQTFGHHATSTAKIGGDSDAYAVLDAEFRVRGVEGLRVVDASAFPRTPGVFPAVATFMLGQKAADVILE
ncbi:GMC oxidoreductase, partial [Cladorrhinum sp. PSN332]